MDTPEIGCMLHLPVRSKTSSSIKDSIIISASLPNTRLPDENFQFFEMLKLMPRE
jgi:hypothetical protein